MTRHRTFLALSAVAVFLVAACSSSSGLTGKTWQLTAITEQVPAFQGVVPTDQQANYTIEFATDDTFSAKADCNQVGGGYTTTSSNGLTITPGPMTLVACP
jgi:heat shock protein HslJ